MSVRELRRTVACPRLLALFLRRRFWNDLFGGGGLETLCEQVEFRSTEEDIVKEHSVPLASSFRRSTSFGTLSLCHRSLNSASRRSLLSLASPFNIKETTHLSQPRNPSGHLRLLPPNQPCPASPRSRIPSSSAHPSEYESHKPRCPFRVPRLLPEPPSMTL